MSHVCVCECVCVLLLFCYCHVWLCNPTNCSLPGSSVNGISQERILEWVAISFYRGSSETRGWTCFTCIGRQIFLSLSHQVSPEPCVCVSVCTHMYACMCVCVLTCFSRVQLFVTLWTIACQSLLSMGFSR